MDDMDLGRVRELRSVVRWAADPRAFDLLRGMRDARWAVAEAPGGELAGMVGAVPFGGPSGGIGILCHLAVRDGWRNRGLGAKLSRWAVCYLRSRGVGVVRLDSTPPAEKLYRSLGFVSRAGRITYRLEEAARGLRARGASPEERGVGATVREITAGDLPEVCGVDRWAYGADRSALLLAILRVYPGEGLVARDATGRIKGYLVRSSAGDTARIGPFLAADERVAGALLRRALRACGDSAVEVTVPCPPGRSADPARAWLEGFGFEPREERLRMELGERRTVGGGLRQYATTPYLAT